MKSKTAGGRLKKETIKNSHKHHGHRFGYVSSNHWGRGLYPSISQRCCPACWCCIRQLWGSSFPFNAPHTKIFQEPNGEAWKTRYYYAACPKQVRQHNRYHFTGHARRRRPPIEIDKVLQEVEKYRKFKADIRNETKAKVKQIKKEQRKKDI